MAAIGIGNMLDVIGEIPLLQSMQALVDKRSQLEIHVAYAFNACVGFDAGV